MKTLAALLALIGVGIVLVKLRSLLKRRAAAINLVLAKATFMALSSDEQNRVHDTAIQQLNGMMGGRFKGFNGDYDRFGCYAHAMARLGIPPTIKDYCYPRWYMVKNPFFDVRPTDPIIAQITAAIVRKHGIAVSISKEDEFFARIRATIERAESSD